VEFCGAEPEQNPFSCNAAGNSRVKHVMYADWKKQSALV